MHGVLGIVMSINIAHGSYEAVQYRLMNRWVYWEINTKLWCPYFSYFSSKDYYSLPPTRITGHPRFYQRNSLIEFEEVCEILIVVALRAWGCMCFATDNFSFLSKFHGCTHTNFCFSFLFLSYKHEQTTSHAHGLKVNGFGEGRPVIPAWHWSRRNIQ